MATFKTRSVSEIYEQLITYKNSIPELSGLYSNVDSEQTLLDTLQSTSKVAKWSLYLYIVAWAIWVLENIMLLQVKEVEEIRDSAFTGSAVWYSNEAKKFQYGDVVGVSEETNYKPSYKEIDTAKQIIGNVAVEDISGKVVLKIRGKNSDILTEDELNSFIGYINNIKFIGTKIAIQNDEADKLKLIGSIIYKSGKVVSEIRTNVENSISDFIKNIPFNSYLVVNDLIKTVRAIDGVVNFEINTIQAKASNTLVFSNVTHKYRAFAGYLSIDTNYPLSTFLTYNIE